MRSKQTNKQTDRQTTDFQKIRLPNCLTRKNSQRPEVIREADCVHSQTETEKDRQMETQTETDMGKEKRGGQRKTERLKGEGRERGGRGRE